MLNLNISLVVAILAMFITAYQAYLARSHARISVRPHLDWGTYKYSSKPVVLYILNIGLGPAIINSLTLILDEKSYLIDNLDMPEEIINKISSISGYTEYNLFSQGTLIANNIEFNLFLFEDKTIGINPHRKAYEFLDRIGIEIHYSSMYGEKFFLQKNLK